MRNLNLLRNVTIEDTFLTNLAKCFVVSESSSLKCTKLFFINQQIEVYKLNIKEDSTFENSFVIDLFQFIDEPELGPYVVGCNFIYNELYVILSTGYLISVVVHDDEAEENKAWGQSLGIGPTKLASWSPDLERTVVVNADDQVFVLTIVDADFEKVNEISLQDVSEEQNKFVTVGWGSAETQFRGSEGKLSKNVTAEVVDENVVADTSVRVCWKQNGIAFAVSYVCRAEQSRKVKVFSQDGFLLNVTKNICGLQSPIDWCPSRNLIFCPQTLPNKQVVCCLEENALRHGEFELSKDTRVKDLLWNTSGTILACHGTSDGGEFVILWTTSNYKWYVKQRLQFKESVIYLQWDHLSPNKLHVILKPGVYRSYEWNREINESNKCGGDGNKALVCNINGHLLGITPYALVSLPPSMPYETYDVSPRCINAVVFPESYRHPVVGDFDCNSMILYLNDDSLRVLKYGEKINYDLRFSVANNPLPFSTPSELSAFLWTLPSTLYFSWCKTDGHYFCVGRMDIENKSVSVQKIFKIDSTILATCSHNDEVIVHLENGKLFLYRDETLRSLKIAFVEPCVRLKMLNKDTLIALSENRNLYVNDGIRWRDVVSFYWKPPFIVVLTMDSQLIVSKVNVDRDEITFDEIHGRNVEPKSFLVTVIDGRVLLEMERGNLEIIVPRPFSLHEMEEKLKNAQYFEAFKMLQKHRINLNVLFDHDPDNFTKNVNDIIDKVSDSMYLLNFITELENGNVAASMFPWRYGAAKPVPHKIDAICDTLCSALKHRLPDNAKLTAPLVATLIKQNKLAEAAKYAIQSNEMTTFNHLCDPLAAYKDALRAFDLTNALQIIQHTKLDPSEYLPFIQQLQNMDENYRKYKICDYVEDIGAALEHLADCCDEDDKFEECVEYVQKHEIFWTALEVFAAKRATSELWRQRYVSVMNVVAENRYENGQYSDAAILFEKADRKEKALECYLKAGDWSSAMSLAKNMNLEGERMASVCKEAYDVLYGKAKFADAGFVAHHFLSDCALSVDAYLRAFNYCDAINTAKSLKNDELIDAKIRPELLKYTDSSICAYEEKYVNLLIGYADRLQTVREKKMRQDRDVGDDGQSVASSSDGSDTSSVLSSSSKASSTSTQAKRLRKKESKLWSVKVGNRREEQGLLMLIRQTIKIIVDEYCERIPSLIKALVQTDDFVVAKNVNTRFEVISKTVEKIISQVWNEENLPKDGAGFRDILITVPPEVTAFNCNLSLLDFR